MHKNYQQSQSIISRKVHGRPFLCLKPTTQKGIKAEGEFTLLESFLSESVHVFVCVHACIPKPFANWCDLIQKSIKKMRGMLCWSLDCALYSFSCYHSCHSCLSVQDQSSGGPGISKEVRPYSLYFEYCNSCTNWA